MLSDFLKSKITSQAGFITANGGYGYGQVEPNHLSAQRTSQVYAQLPAAADINVLEQGQFVKYDYANGSSNGSGLNGLVSWHSLSNASQMQVKFNSRTPYLLSLTIS